MKKNKVKELGEGIGHEGLQVIRKWIKNNYAEQGQGTSDTISRWAVLSNYMY